MSALPDSPILPADPVNQVLTPVHDPFDTPLFNRLLGLIEKQSATMEEQKATMIEQKQTLIGHGTKLDAFGQGCAEGLGFCSLLMFHELTSAKDDQPYDKEQDPITNEQL